MSEDATIAATAADIEADVAALKTSEASSAALIATLQAEIAAGCRVGIPGHHGRPGAGQDRPGRGSRTASRLTHG